jgi:hypothetical protein
MSLCMSDRWFDLSLRKRKKLVLNLLESDKKPQPKPSRST